MEPDQARTQQAPEMDIIKVRDSVAKVSVRKKGARKATVTKLYGALDTAMY